MLPSAIPVMSPFCALLVSRSALAALVPLQLTGEAHVSNWSASYPKTVCPVPLAPVTVSKILLKSLLYCHATEPVTSPLHVVLVVSIPSYVKCRFVPYGPRTSLVLPAPLGVPGG